MAIYATVSQIDLQIRYLGSASTITSAIKANFINEIETIVNGKLSNRYAVPFGVNSVPPMISTITAKLATSYTLTNIGIKDTKLNEGIMKRLEMGWKWLDDIANGKMTLTDSSGNIVGESTSRQDVLSTTKDFKPVFDMRNDTTWHVDPDLIQSENDKVI